MRLVVISILLSVCHVTGNDIVERAPDPVAELTSVTNHLTSQLNSLTAEVTDLKAQLNQKSEVITNLTSDLRARKHELDVLNAYCHNHVNTLTSRVVTLENPVSFTVHFYNDTVSGNMTQQVSGNTRDLRLVFDVIQSQTGGHNYNASTGYFTAPSTGTYAFFVTLQRSEQHANVCVQATIMRGLGNRLSVATACPDGYTSASNMGISHLNKGDQVSVRTAESANVFGYMHTTFSGFKLSLH